MSAGFLLDTNVLSEFNHKQPPDANVKHWVESIQTSLLYVSVITLSEIRLGIELLAEGKRRKQLEQWLHTDLRRWFNAGRILGIDEETGALWAQLTAQRQSKGKPLNILDGLIAATAVKSNLTMVTRDVSGFAFLGIPVINPWEPTE